LFILYGRRRVGKTELLQVFCRDKPHIFFVATTASDAAQLARFTEQALGFQDIVPGGLAFPSWDDAFAHLVGLPDRPVVILDEFTYLLGGNRAISFILQKAWDTKLKQSKLFLVLCGSYMGMMEREVLGCRAPLYGRRTGSWLLDPLDLAAAVLLCLPTIRSRPSKPGPSLAASLTTWRLSTTLSLCSTTLDAGSCIPATPKITSLLPPPR
jgi:AAA+ ATPase superfamily predicted ATPase